MKISMMMMMMMMRILGVMVRSEGNAAAAALWGALHECLVGGRKAGAAPAQQPSSCFGEGIARLP